MGRIFKEWLDGGTDFVCHSSMGQRVDLKILPNIMENITKHQFILDVTSECVKVYFKLEKYKMNVADGLMSEDYGF